MANGPSIFRDFHPTAGDVVAALALVIIALLCGLFVFFSVPVSNKELITFGLGAIAGALTVGGGRKIADKITNSTGDNATVQPETRGDE